MSEEVSVYTVSSYYFATGEGHTYCIMFTRAYPRLEDYTVQPEWKKDAEGNLVYIPGEYDAKEAALGHFIELFGEWVATGAEVHEGLHFDNPAAKLLISPELQKQLTSWNENAGGFEYHSMIHLNFA